MVETFVARFAEAFRRDGVGSQDVVFFLRAGKGLYVVLNAQVYFLVYDYPAGTVIKT